MKYKKIEEPLKSFLQQLSSRLIVVGSVARGSHCPKDLDLLWDLDSDRAKKEILKGIKKNHLVYESAMFGSWTFYDYGWMVEILGIHRGPSYKQVKRRAIIQRISGIDLMVAHPDDS